MCRTATEHHHDTDHNSTGTVANTKEPEMMRLDTYSTDPSGAKQLIGW